MKYPQLVSMPSTVQDWLDEQLEARGIDAVVYTRYIFSLLQTDTLDFPDDLLTLSTSKSKEVGRRGRKRGRREEYWDVCDCEQLKRSAAVECLMSASDQKFGIEKLVDELCAKLKEIQSEGEVTATQAQPPVSELQSHSPSDQAQKYYAAFPPLNKSDNSNSKAVLLNICQSSAWGGKKILSSSFGKKKQKIGDLNPGCNPLDAKHCVENKENQSGNATSKLSDVGRVNMKSINQENDKYMHYSAEELGFGFALNMNAIWCDDDESEFLPHFNAITGWRVCKYNRNNTEEMEGIAVTEEPLGAEKEIWDTDCCQYHNQGTGNEQKVSAENESFEKESGQYVDEKLAQFIAKFDHSIETLWSPERGSENTSPEEKVDSVSPLVTSQSVNADLSNSVVSNPVSNSGHPFLLCGTNITNSIWSTRPPLTKALSSDEKAHLEQLNSSGQCANGINNEIAEGKGAVGSLDTIFGSCDKIVGSKCINAADIENLVKPHEASFPFITVESNTIAENLRTNETKEDWNNMDSLLLTSTTLGSTECLNRDKFRIASEKGWPIAENSEPPVDNFPRYNMFPNSQKMENSGNISDCSFGTLNHNKEDSSFTEVIPKQSICRLNSQNSSSPHVNKSCNRSDGSYQRSNINKDTVPEKEKEEEDLLTSTRTHFRPIRHEHPDTQNNNTACYADGTTFVIPNSWESVPFKRSESGALYLETDLGIETPQKYMEYKEKEFYSNRYKSVESPDYSASLGRDFIPKFRVYQIEKCCQTEESEEYILSDEEIDSKRSKQDVKSLDSEFYFPGDEHFAEKVVNCLESDDEPVKETAMDSESISLLPENNGCDTKVVQLTNHREHQTFQTVSDTLLSSKKMEETSLKWSPVVKNCSKCSCNNISMSKSEWYKMPFDVANEIWGSSSATVKPHTCFIRNPVWSSSYDNGAGMCRNCGDASKKSPLMSPQRLRLREELSLDGEQLLSDLRYMQYLYQGSDSNDSVAGGVQKMQCLSPPAETSNDIQLYDDSEFGSSQAHFSSRPIYDHLHGKENESFGDFVASCTPKVLPVKVLLSVEVGKEKKMNERPFRLKRPAKDRKRRHSGCLRQINNNQNPENSNICVKACHGSSAAVGNHTTTIKDAVRWKGSCSSHSLRPVTL